MKRLAESLTQFRIENDAAASASFLVYAKRGRSREASDNLQFDYSNAE